MSLPKFPFKVLGLRGGGLVVSLVVIILALTHKAREVKLHVQAERLSFMLVEDQPRSLFHPLPLTAVTIRGFADSTMEVQSLRENGQTLLGPGNRLTLQNNPAQTGTLTLSGAALYLLELPLEPGASVRLFMDNQHRVTMVLQSTPEPHLAFTVQGPLTLTTNEVVAHDAQHNRIVAGGTHHLEVSLLAQTLLLTREAQQPWNLILDVTQQRHVAPAQSLLFPLVPGLKVAQVDFHREVDHKLVSAIKRLWIEPHIIPEDQARGPVYLQIPRHEAFTFKAMVLTDEGLECTFQGSTDTLNVGEDAPRHNILPSWLGYLLDHQVIQRVIELFRKQ